MLKITADSISNKNGETVLPEEIILYLNDEVSLENVTFERFFNLILLNNTFFDIVFYRALGGFKIIDFMTDFMTEPVVRGEFENVTTLQLTWASDLYTPNNSEYENISFFIDFTGRSMNENEIGYSLTFSSLSEYKHLPLVINNVFSIYKKNEPLITVTRNMTLYDVIRAILYEITFYGNPISREVFKDEFVKVTKDMELENTVQAISFDELFQNVKDDLDPDVRAV